MDFPSGQFGGGFGEDGGDMFSGGNSGFGQFPSMDNMFGEDGMSDDLYDVNAFVRKARARNATRFIGIGLHFFGQLRKRP